MKGANRQALVIIFTNSIRNSKPAEKQGRKAMGLPSRSRDQDSQVAEDKIIKVLGEPGNH